MDAQDAPLSTAHYQEVRRALWTMKPQWRNIALVLGFQLYRLNGFTGSDGDKMDQLLEVWLNHTYSTPTWRALVSALRDETVSGGNPVADQIEASIGQSSAGGAQHERDLHPSPKPKRALLRQLSQDINSSSSTNESEMSFPEFNCQFVVFITGLIEILEKHEGALPRMKTGLEQLVLPLRFRKFVRIVRSEEYKDATSVKELFRLLAPHWHCVDYNFLSTLVKVSECQAAEEKLQAFLQSSAVTASSLILQKARADIIVHHSSHHPAEATANVSSQKLPHQPGASSVASTIPHTSVCDTANEKALLPSQQPLDEPICTQPQPLFQVQVEAKVDTDVLTLSDYEKHASILCGVLKLPRYALSFFGTGTGCISVRWHMSSDLLPYVMGVRISDGNLQSLAEQKIVQIRIGQDFVLVIPTLSYWEGCAEASVIPESQPLLPSSESAAKVTMTTTTESLVGSTRSEEVFNRYLDLLHDEENKSIDTAAIEIAMRLKAIGEDIDVQVKKHWGEVIAELCQQHTVFDIGIDQFKTMCRRVLNRSSASVRSGWEQVALIYIGMGNIVQKLRRQNLQDQSQRERQLQDFAGQFMQDVGLDRWIILQGGMRNIGNLPDSSYPAVVEISPGLKLTEIK